MLLEPDGSPAWRSEDVLSVLPEHLSEHARGETHGLALELATNPHATVGEAASELRFMRAGLAATVRGRSACAPRSRARTRWSRAEEVEVSPGARYQFLHQSLRELARREPTFALHVHVAVPDPEMAVRAYNGMRAHIPVLLALSANSPVHARAGLRAGQRPHAGVPGVPAHGHPARVRLLRRVRRVDRRADPLRRDPRADVHLVGRAAAAASSARSRCA